MLSTKVNNRFQRIFPSSQPSSEGVIRGQLIRPINRVGVYVPGGTAAYPSSVLMNVIPAKIAGVKEIIMITPPQEHFVPAILVAAKLAGVDSIYQVGGAQGVAALAFGTETIPKAVSYTHLSYDSDANFTDYLTHFDGEIVTTEHYDLSNPYTKQDDVPEYEAYMIR